MKIARHKVLKPKWIRQRIDQTKQLIAVSIEHLPEIPDNLYSLIDDCVRLADLQAAFRDSRPEIRDSLHIVAQAAVAVFRMLRRPNDPVPFTIADHTGIVCTRPPNPELMDSGAWLFGFYAALICQDEELLEELAAVPVRGFVYSTVVSELESQLLFAEALRDNCNGNPDGVQRLRQAIAASGDIDDPGSRLLVPPLQLAEAIYRCPDEFNGRLAEAVQLHKQFFERELKAGRIAGYLAFRLLGVSALAVRRGIAIDVETDYLPAELLYPSQSIEAT